jgi:oxygen-independent coproporphyrinogen-3 oxidase
MNIAGTLGKSGPGRAAPPWIWPQAAYIHVPFCAHHCGYCDFAVVAGKDFLMDQYLDGLVAEMSTLGQPQQVNSIFIGGGTPTYLDCRRLERLLMEIQHWFIPAADHNPHSFDIEFSVEANPGTLTNEKVGVLADHGVTRVSLGNQSFQPHVLQVLERDHSPADVPRALEAVKARISQVSLDLIFGVPGQTQDDWRQDLRRTLALQPDHVSTYGLTYEKGTRLWKQRQLGEVQPLDEETELAMYLDGLDILHAAGFEHYEISNHARPGKRCGHNQVYWANEAYFGFGLGAARYIEGRRELNTRSIPDYIRKTLAGESPTFQSEKLEPVERARETMALQLRRAEGIDRQGFRHQTGFRLDELAGVALARHVELGLLEDTIDTVHLTRKGKCVADAVIREMMRGDGSRPTPEHPE